MIKSEVQVPKKNPPTLSYPYIGVSSTGLVVLFNAVNSGTILDPGILPKKIGQHQNDWMESSFSPLEGSITLSNYRESLK